MGEFDEIRPYEAGEMKQAFNDLLNDRQFQLILAQESAQRTPETGLYRCEDTARFPAAVYETYRLVYHPQTYRWLLLR